MQSQTAPLLSVISVTKDDPSGLLRTIRSLDTLRGRVAFEQLIVDSSPGAVAPAGVSWPVRFIAQEPQGVYAAMNEGIRSAKGRVIWFLNGGDEMRDPEAVVLAANACDSGGEVVASSVEVRRTDGSVRLQKPPGSLRWGVLGVNRFCHQGTFFRAALFQRLGTYSGLWRLASDYDFLVRCYLDGVSYRGLSGVVASYALGGVSDIRYRDVLTEFASIREAHFGGIPLWQRLVGWVAFQLGALRVHLAKHVKRAVS